MIARIIRKALEILNGKTGIVWEKDYMGHLDAKFADESVVDSFFDLDADQLGRVRSVCTLGALELAARELRLTREDYTQAAEFVARFGLSSGRFDNRYTDENSPFVVDTIPEFNDDPERTQAEVTSLLRDALSSAEALPITVTPEALLSV